MFFKCKTRGAGNLLVDHEINLNDVNNIFVILNLLKDLGHPLGNRKSHSLPQNSLLIKSFHPCLSVYMQSSRKGCRPIIQCHSSVRK